ncbi:MAG TPA: PDZ domain-containing protein [Verrucomicrobiota bacterium]|nr:PDZ domain-containing protein [Verrucomicrobiota bacterium]HRR64087.1 PDZ domain-containing protein [Candidatus Paceibacterota bacterium]NLH83842.1 PDZ domain-containing protein [Verrucomicrobiota bacterium]HNS68889.1 PDZ domain-containing protein [Verrucomicrobiota bacterium]HOF71046.1 PDZ domain-containing protein [Verrucomicrobiota bacterium]
MLGRNLPPWRGGLALALSLLMMIASGDAGARSRPEVRELNPQIEAAIAKVKPALVRIRVVETDYSEGRETKSQAVGSGVIITRDGYLVTNHHVAGHAVRIFCTLWNREEIEAELVGTDALTDIAVLRLTPARPVEFKTASFGDSSKVQAGDYVLAMGSPMALSQSVTLGIISNPEMIMPRSGRGERAFRLDGEDVGSLVRWLGHDAAIYGGNSGGPLVNLRGEIIGINEISYGLGGAIPGNLARSVAEQIMAKGRVVRSWLGLDVQPRFKRSTEPHGVLISGVQAGSPADQAGFKPGDLLLRLGGAATDVRFDEQMPDFMLLATSLPLGQETRAVVKRNGKELTLRPVPIERGEVYPPQQELKAWGLTVRDLSRLLAQEMKRADPVGALVTSVRPGGPAGTAKPALQAKDVIVAVNDQPVRSTRDLVALTRKLTEGRTEPLPVMATFERRAARLLAMVRIGLDELKDPGLEVTKAWLPVETQVISREIARQLGQPALKGFYITRVYPGTTAEQAGLKAGDFITAVDGEKLSASDSEHEDELSALIRQYDVGQTVTLTIRRGQAEHKLPVSLARSPRLQREMRKYRNEDFEFTARDVSFFDVVEEQWSRDQLGVLVEEVKPGSWAELGSLFKGDLILEVAGQPVDKVDALRQELERAAARRDQVVRFKVLRGIHTTYLEIEPNWKN